VAGHLESFDEWLDNHGNPGIDNGTIIAECPFNSEHVIYGTESDIDSGLRKHIEYCPDALEDDDQ
jgi:hypothetical protein